jgi:OFA family oxalate/formate antiporter-like MFS transporter
MNNPWFQLAASLIAMVMIANLQYAWTLFVEPMRDARTWDLSAVQGAFSFFIILQTWVQPLDGWFIDRLGPRLFITVAGILCGVGWTAMGYATSLPQLYFYYGLAGIGAAFVYSGCIGSALKWFPARRGFASGVIAAGFGGGTAIFVPIIAYFIREYDYRMAFLVTGLVQGLVITIMAQFLRHPGADFAPPKAASSASAAKSRRNTENFTTTEMLRTPHFYVLHLMFVAMATGGLFVTANSGSLVRSWGMTVGILTTAAALSPLANAASRIFWGWFSDRAGREKTMVIAFLLQAACLVAVVTLGRRSGTMFTITLILTYFTWGEIFSLFPSTLGDYFGGKHATSNYAFLYTAKGVAALIGGFLAAAIYEQFGSWDAVFYGSAVLALLSGFSAYAMRNAPLPRKAHSPALVSSHSAGGRS